MTRTIPNLDDLTDPLTAALSFAAAGIYVVPVRRGTKNPGSVLGKDWPIKSSRDPQQIAAWFAGTDYGLALHVGRSGLVVFDIDHPDKLPAVLADAVASCPFQATRPDADERRGHAVFRTDRRFGNGTGGLGGTWGQVRGTNGVIMSAPSVHPEDGEYRWLRTGEIPELPAAVAELLPDAVDTEDAANDTEVHRFLTEHSGGDRPELLAGVLRLFDRKITDGESRHDTAVTPSRAGRCGRPRPVSTPRPRPLTRCGIGSWLLWPRTRAVIQSPSSPASWRGRSRRPAPMIRWRGGDRWTSGCPTWPRWSRS